MIIHRFVQLSEQTSISQPYRPIRRAISSVEFWIHDYSVYLACNDSASSRRRSSTAFSVWIQLSHIRIRHCTQPLCPRQLLSAWATPSGATQVEIHRCPFKVHRPFKWVGRLGHSKGNQSISPLMAFTLYVLVDLLSLLSVLLTVARSISLSWQGDGTYARL